MGGGVRSKDYVCKDAVQGLGRGWAAVCGAAGLGCFAVMAQIVSGWWSSRHQGYNGVCRSSESCGEDYVQLCALVHTGCTRQNRFSVTPTARPTGFVVDVGGQDFCGHRRARAQENEDRQMCGEWRSMRQHFILVIAASTLHLIIGHCNCLLLGCLWAQHLCYL